MLHGLAIKEQLSHTEPRLGLWLDNLGHIVHVGPLLVDEFLQSLASLPLPRTIDCGKRII